MNSVFSVEDLSDAFWQSIINTSASAMNRSPSEWDLEKFLEELSCSASNSATDDKAPPPGLSQSPTSSRRRNCDDEVLEIQCPRALNPPPPHTTLPQPLDRNPSAAIDSEQYRAFLKSKLDQACAAAAMSMVSGAKTENFPSVTRDQRHDSNFQSGSKASDTGSGMPTFQREPNGESVKIPVLPVMQRNEETQVRQTTSDSSKEDSDDDDLEGDTGTNDNMDTIDAKRVRRMQSNRESARRSRKRKQAQLNELETQVSQLRDERSSLLSRQTDVNKNCDEAVVNNRILRANIETLRAKVKMVEEQVKQVTGLNPMLLARSNMPSMDGQLRGQADATQIVTGSVQPNSNRFFPHPQLVPSVNAPASHLARLNNGFPTNPVIPVHTNSQNGNGGSNIAGIHSVVLAAGGQSTVNKSQYMPKQIGAGEALLPCDSGRSHAVSEEKEIK
ncbi:hypothetical protein K2173_025728 [Erythroxylum novogranatense]|uniref:BZIP domain-containing protein n=1 Tax=Erythroxylum novogranatense TaxID=1862640 RepID=A0AAV8SBI0_9ROSI|nr:hypothetical protein K2173_025728 [Erythroxylum novogranatense]